MSISDNVREIVEDSRFNLGYSSLNDEHITRYMEFVNDPAQEILKSAERIRDLMHDIRVYSHDSYLVRENNVQIEYRREIIFRCARMLMNS